MTDSKKILLSLSIIASLFAEEPMHGYLYPVDTINHEGKKKMCVLYQKWNGLELYFWDPVTHKSTLGLLSFFQPTSLTVLPNQEAFSFIDNDRIRVKYVNKRSPKSLDFYGPYDLTTITWIDNENFYFSAKERRHHNLFHATTDGDLFRLTVSNTHHYLYPQKVDETLFFIESTEDGDYAIKSIEYPTQYLANKIDKEKRYFSLEDEIRTLIAQEDVRETYKPILDIQSATTLVALEHTRMQETALAFLHMISLTEGFFIQYTDHIDKDQKVLELDYYSLYTNGSEWTHTFLFTFSIPLYFIMYQKGKIVMSESILPFLPFHNGTSIYLTKYDDDKEILELFEYTREDKNLSKCLAGQNYQEIFFAPRRFNGQIICGGSLTGNQKPHVMLKSDGFHYFDMPILYE